MVTNFDTLIGREPAYVTEAELLGAVNKMTDNEVLEAFETEPAAMGFILPTLLQAKKIRERVLLQKKIKKLPKAKRKAILKSWRIKQAKKAGKAALIFAPISPVGKIAALVALRRKAKKKKAAKAAATRGITATPAPEPTPSPVLTPPPAPTYQAPQYTPPQDTTPQYTQPHEAQQQETEQEQEQPAETQEQEKPKFDIKKALPLIALAALPFLFGEVSSVFMGGRTSRRRKRK